MRQCEVVAMVRDRRERANTALTAAYHTLQKSELMAGLVRTYRPKTEGDTVYPAERKNAQASVDGILNGARAAAVTMFDTVLTQDVGNCEALADVICTNGGRSFKLDGIPATHLLFLEKQLTDLLTTVKAIPVLDPSETWTFDQATSMFRSETQRTTKTKKIAKPVVLYQATPEHPAQVQLAHEDVVEGEWEGVKFSGAITRVRKDGIVARVVALKEAVIEAREKANSITVEQRKEGDGIWDFIFGS